MKTKYDSYWKNKPKSKPKKSPSVEGIKFLRRRQKVIDKMIKDGWKAAKEGRIVKVSKKTVRKRNKSE